MRLSSQQIDIIKHTVADVFGSDVSVSLFGSRLYDDSKGGDIDLLIVSPERIEQRVAKTARLTAKLQMALGERKFDVVVKDPSLPHSDFLQRVTEKAVRL